MKTVIQSLTSENRRQRKSVKQAEYFPIEAHEAYGNAQIMNGESIPVHKTIGADEPELMARVLSGDDSGTSDRPVVGQAPKRRLLGRREPGGSAILLPFEAYESWWKENGQPESGVSLEVEELEKIRAALEQKRDELKRKIRELEGP